MGKPATPVLDEHTSTNPRTPKQKTNKNISRSQTPNKSSDQVKADGVLDQLAPGNETVIPDVMNNKEVRQSEGAASPTHLEEDGGMPATEGARNPAQQNMVEEQACVRRSQRHVIPSSRIKSNKRKRSVFDASKPTVQTHPNQRISKRKRKRNTLYAALSVIKRANKMHKHRRS